MSVLIEGTEMPKDGETVTLTICADGLVFEEFKEPGDVFHAVPVPAHGDLVDRDVLKKQGYFFPCAIGTEYAIPLLALREAPAVIPAEPCNNLSKPCKEEGK